MKKTILLFTGLLLVAAIVYMGMYGKSNGTKSSVNSSQLQSIVPAPPAPPIPPKAPTPPTLPEIPKVNS